MSTLEDLQKEALRAKNTHRATLEVYASKREALKGQLQESARHKKSHRAEIKNWEQFDRECRASVARAYRETTQARKTAIKAEKALKNYPYSLRAWTKRNPGKALKSIGL